MTSSSSVSPRYVPEQVLPGLVLTHPTVAALLFAIVLAASAQIAVAIPGTPVVMTGQTFVVLVGPFLLGAARAVSGSALYLGAGLLGVPWFAVSGGATLGYIVGFVVINALLGTLVERRLIRGVGRILLAMGGASLVIYAFGVAGLLVVTGMNLETAIAVGVVPFLVGDAIKVLMATAAVSMTLRLGDAAAG